LIKATGVFKSYGKQSVLADISFSLEKGKVLGIFGPNGAGKTTLLKILALLFKPDQGNVHINGLDAVQHAQTIRPLIGYVPQEVALYEDLSVADNLLCWSRGRRVSKEDPVYMRIASALDIHDLARKKVRTLSGGMKRRVNLAVALMNTPQILIMDEPLVGVDLVQRQTVLEHLKELAAQGVTQIITSHYPGELLSFVDQVMILDNGKMQRYEHSQTLMKNNGQNQMTNLDNVIFDIVQGKGE